MSKLWLVIKNRDSKRTFTKYFENEKIMNNYINKIKYINNVFIIEDSRDIIFN